MTLSVVERHVGADLIGHRYVPPFDYYYQNDGEQQGDLKAGGREYVAWRVVAADFVTIESGTGVVHQAPAFGEVDYDVLIAEQDRFEKGTGPQLICAVGPDGKFTEEAPDWQGRWVKEADKDIARHLREAGRLYLLDQCLHEYPFCWRADEDPLIQYPRKSWFVRTTRFKDQMLENNRRINWLPEHIRDGRFGNFLETNVDWALSRERFWGTPLPIWICDETGEMEAIGNYDELLSKPGVAGQDLWAEAKAANPELPDDLCVHKPYIDNVTYDSPFADGARMRRVSEVIDCWYDSGAMPFAQWGYPTQNADRFRDQFPADFISEAIDQTRGWFYSQLAISTILFGNEAGDSKKSVDYPHPFANCIVLGLMLAESYICTKCGHRHNEEVKKCGECGAKVNRKTEKMSKRLRNYREPSEIFNKYGADALRWYFFANQPPWTSIIYSERAIKESIPEFLLRLWNVYSFFVIYANIDGFAPSERTTGAVDQINAVNLAKGMARRPVSERSELDRWILSELNATAATVTTQMDEYDNYGACSYITSFVDALSNWYLRRSRDRFWSPDKQDPDKLDAYWTLYECLITVSKLIAPFTPFLAEALWRNLAGVFGERAIKSVHLCDYPTADKDLIDDQLSQRMALLREIASLGRAARMENRLKVRQPLAKVQVILVSQEHQAWLSEHDELLKEELNVKQVEYTEDADEYITYLVQPNFKVLGPKVGKLMPKVKQTLQQQDGATLLAEMQSRGIITLELDRQTVELTSDEIQIGIQSKEGWAAKDGRGCVVVLSTELTPELIREGLVRDLVRLVQDRRKSLGCEFTDRIEVGIVTESDELAQAIDQHRNYLMGETLADTVSADSMDGIESVPHTIGDHEVSLYVAVVQG